MALERAGHLERAVGGSCRDTQRGIIREQEYKCTPARIELKNPHFSQVVQRDYIYQHVTSP